MTNLFTPVQIGNLTLTNRIVMAPLTRGRADSDRIPNELMAEYYRQRARAGLIVTEATNISQQAIGWSNTPGIYTDAQVKGWQQITRSVHQQGGRIFLQLWHMGRASHPDFQPDRALPVSPSAIIPEGEIHTPQGKKPYVTPRALELDEIPKVIQQYSEATKRAREAGFDGVEIHAANGYLIDQFLRDGANHRTDAYGGNIANRTRFLLEVTEAVAKAWNANSVGVRLSPRVTSNGIWDSDPIGTFTYAAEALNQFDLAYLHIFEALPGHFWAEKGERVTPHMRRAFQGTVILNGGFDAPLGNEAIVKGEADLIAYGVPFIANPDLVERYRQSLPLNEADPSTFYTPGKQGYTDYPTIAEQAIIT
ncbi:MAG: alkene reductase [Cyanobacteria bacterium P01_C01_bin.72]